MATKFSAPTPAHHDAITAAGKQVAARSGKLWQLDDEIQLAAADEAVEKTTEKASEKAAAPVAESTATGSTTSSATPAATEGSTAAASAGTEAGAATGAATGATATPAASAAAPAAAAGVSPWAIAGGVLGVAAIAAAAGGGSDNKSSNSNISQADKDSGPAQPPAVTQPPADAQPGDTTPNAPNTPATPATPDASTTVPQTPADPTQQGISVAHDNAGNAFDKSLFGHSIANTQQIRIDRIQAAEGSDLDGRIYRDYKVGGVDHHTAYEVIKVGAEGVTWEQAKAHAESLGGRLLVINDGAEAEFLAQHLSSRLGETPSEFGGLAKGSWVGLSQDASATAADAGWHWETATGPAAFTPTDWANFGTTLAGHGKLPSDGSATTSNVEAHKADHGAIIAAYQLPTNGEQYGTFAKTMLFDHGGKLNSFVIEYDGYQSPLKQAGAGGALTSIVEGQIISADQFDTIRWDSVLNNGGKISYTAVDSTESTAKPLEGARPVTITITEQAATQPASGYGNTSALKELLSASADEHLLLG